MAFPSVIDVAELPPIDIAIAVAVSYAGQFTRVEILVDVVFIEHTPVLPILTPVLDTVPRFNAPESASTRVHNTLPLHCSVLLFKNTVGHVAPPMLTLVARVIPIFNTVPAPLLVSTVLTPKVPSTEVVIPDLPIIKLVALLFPIVIDPALPHRKSGNSFE